MVHLFNFPIELLKSIVDLVDSEDLLALRQTNKTLLPYTDERFASKFIRRREHFMSVYSLQTLASIAKHEFFGPKIDTIYFSALRLEEGGDNKTWVYLDSMEHHNTLDDEDYSKICSAMSEVFEALDRWGKPITIGITDMFDLECREGKFKCYGYKKYGPGPWRLAADEWETLKLVFEAVEEYEVSIKTVVVDLFLRENDKPDESATSLVTNDACAFWQLLERFLIFHPTTDVFVETDMLYGDGGAFRFNYIGETCSLKFFNVSLDDNCIFWYLYLGRWFKKIEIKHLSMEDSEVEGDVFNKLLLEHANTIETVKLQRVEFDNGQMWVTGTSRPRLPYIKYCSITRCSNHDQKYDLSFAKRSNNNLSSSIGFEGDVSREIVRRHRIREF